MYIGKGCSYIIIIVVLMYIKIAYYFPELALSPLLTSDSAYQGTVTVMEESLTL